MNRFRFHRPSCQALILLGATLLFAAPAAASEGGLVIFPDLTQLGILLAMFMALVMPVNWLLVKPLLRVLEERDQRIEGATQRAAALAQEAEESLSRYQSAIDSARAEAETQRSSLIESARGEQSQLAAGARGEAEIVIEQARAEVQSALVDARTALRRDAESLARTAVERILGRALA